MKKILSIIVIAIIVIAGLVIFKNKENTTTTTEPITLSEGLQTISGTVTSNQGEKDGSSLVFMGDDGIEYESIISIPNLGPDSTFDFNNIQNGNRLEITGEVWEMAGVPQLTAQSVKLLQKTDVATFPAGTGINDFLSCEKAGGRIMEKYPRICELNGEYFDEIIEPETLSKGDSVIETFTVGPETVECHGAFPQNCFIVNGEYFYDTIAGFDFKPGYEYVLEVERTQICNPEVLNDCPQDIGIYEYSLKKTLSKTAQTESACADNNGTWQKVGILGNPACIYTYTDGGTTCSSSSDCQGNCIVTEIDGSNPQCAPDSNPFGCKSTVEDFAESGGIMCID